MYFFCKTIFFTLTVALLLGTPSAKAQDGRRGGMGFSAITKDSVRPQPGAGMPIMKRQGYPITGEELEELATNPESSDERKINNFHCVCFGPWIDYYTYNGYLLPVAEGMEKTDYEQMKQYCNEQNELAQNKELFFFFVQGWITNVNEGGHYVVQLNSCAFVADHHVPGR